MSSLLPGTNDIFPFLSAPENVSIPNLNDAELPQAFQLLDTVWLSATPHVTGQLCLCVCHSCAGQAFSVRPFKLLPKSALTQFSVQLASHPLRPKKLIARHTLKTQRF